MDTNTTQTTKFNPAKYAEYVAKKNAAFAKMTKKQQRIAIVEHAPAPHHEQHHPQRWLVRPRRR